MPSTTQTHTYPTVTKHPAAPDDRTKRTMTKRQGGRRLTRALLLLLVLGATATATVSAAAAADANADATAAAVVAAAPEPKEAVAASVVAAEEQEALEEAAEGEELANAVGQVSV